MHYRNDWVFVCLCVRYSLCCCCRFLFFLLYVSHFHLFISFLSLYSYVQLSFVRSFVRLLVRWPFSLFLSMLLLLLVLPASPVRFLLHFYFFDSPFVHFNCTNGIYVSFSQPPSTHTHACERCCCMHVCMFMWIEWMEWNEMNERRRERHTYSARNEFSHFGCVMRYRHIKRLVSKHQIAIVYDWRTECDTLSLCSVCTCVCVFASYSTDYPPHILHLAHIFHLYFFFVWCSYVRVSVCVRACLYGWFLFRVFFAMCVWELRVWMCRCVCCVLMLLFLLLCWLTGWQAALMAGSLSIALSACVCVHIFASRFFRFTSYKVCVLFECFWVFVFVWMFSYIPYPFDARPSQQRQQQHQPQILYISRTRIEIQKKRKKKAFLQPEQSHIHFSFRFSLSRSLLLSLSLSPFAQTIFISANFFFLSRSLLSYPFSVVNLSQNVYITICSAREITWDIFGSKWEKFQMEYLSSHTRALAYKLVFIYFIYVQYVKKQKQRYFLVLFFCHLAKTKVVWCMRYACVYGNESNCLCFCTPWDHDDDDVPFSFLYSSYYYISFHSCVSYKPQLSFLPSIQLRKFPYIFTTGSRNEIIFTRTQFLLLRSCFFLLHFEFKCLFILTRCAERWWLFCLHPPFLLSLPRPSNRGFFSVPFQATHFPHLYNLYLGP